MSDSDRYAPGTVVHAAPLFSEHMPMRTAAPQSPEEDGCFVLETEFTSPHLNRAGSVHGGLVASLLDVAVAGGAGHAVGNLDDWFGITLTLTVNYIAPAQPGPARAVARALGGNMTKTMQAHLVDSAGTLVASAQGTVKVVPRP